MYFYNLIFILGFLPVTMLVYYLTGILFRRWGKSVAAQNLVICLASLLFFSLQENAYLPILLLMIVTDYGVGWLLYAAKKHPSLRSGFFSVAVVLHILALVLFGGSALADSFAELIGAELQIARTPGMLYTETSGILFGGVFGILFYTLHGISYLADIFREKAEPEKNPVNVAVYLAMFPLMVVGPVQIYHKVRDQLRHRTIRRDVVSSGVLRVLYGTVKLILFGLPFRSLFQTILSMGLSELPVFGALFLWVAFFLAVYYLFTGCSDMACGMCLMMGFEFGENYDAPCTALSVTEYWKRWNVSQTEWFREYVYIPLGGNHCDRSVQAWNLFFTWVCVGLWHGFSVNTLVFGVFFGILTVAEFVLDTRSHALFDFHDLRGRSQNHSYQKKAAPARRDIRFQRGSIDAGQFTFRPENFRTNTERTEKNSLKTRPKAEKSPAVPKSLCRFYVIISVAFAWLLLMFETPEELLSFFQALFGLNGAGLGNSATIYYIYSNLLLIFLALAFMTPVPRRILDFLLGAGKKQLAALLVSVAVVAVGAIGLFAAPEILEEDAETNRFYCKITTYISYLTNQNEDKGIYFGGDGYLFTSHKSWLTEESVQQENLGAIAQTMEEIRMLRQTGKDEDDGEGGAAGEAETKISVSCVLVPSASYILSDELPLYAPEWDESLTDQAARDLLGSDYISCVQALKRRSGEDLYYHSEEGVTSIGAYYVYALWAMEMGYTPAPYSERSMRTVYDSFYGSLGRTLRFYPEADSILRYCSFRYIPVTVEYSDGVVTHSIYEEKYLGTKQELSYYLNGTQDIVRVTTNRSEENNLLVVTDDSGRRYMQYFIEHFYTITIVNVNEYEGSITELAEETGANEVLFLFEMSSVYGESAIAEKLKPQ